MCAEIKSFTRRTLELCFQKSLVSEFSFKHGHNESCLLYLKTKIDLLMKRISDPQKVGEGYQNNHRSPHFEIPHEVASHCSHIRSAKCSMIRALKSIPLLTTIPRNWFTQCLCTILHYLVSISRVLQAPMAD